MNDKERELEEWRMDMRRRLSKAHEIGNITDAEYRRQLEEISKPL